MRELRPFLSRRTARVLFSAGLVSFAVGILLPVSLWLYIGNAMRPYLITDAAAAPKTQAALLLGASVLRSGELSSVLRDRANAAIELYRAGAVSKILVSGDDGTNEHNEVTPVAKYLKEAGIKTEDVFLDHAGFDTYSSMYRARDIFHAESVVIVSQEFHLPRALYLARHLGLTAYGFAADHGSYAFSNYLREPYADIKLVFDLLGNRQPKYLGEEVPLSGTGNSGQ